MRKGGGREGRRKGGREEGGRREGGRREEGGGREGTEREEAEWRALIMSVQLLECNVWCLSIRSVVITCTCLFMCTVCSCALSVHVRCLFMCAVCSSNLQ